MNCLKKSSLASLLLLLCNSSFANPGALFSLASSGSAVIVNTTVPGHVYPNAGIKVNNAGATIQNMGAACVPAPNGYCLFSASSNAVSSFMLNGTFIGRTPINMSLCLNGKGALSCQSFSPIISYTPRFAYVTGSDGVTLCQVNPTNGHYINCGLTGSGFIAATSIALNPAETFAYVADVGNGQVDFCSLNPKTGALTNCTATNAGVSFIDPNSVTVNPAGTFAYVTDIGADILYKCAINQATGNFSGCAQTASTGTSLSVSPPVNVTFNAFGTLAFIGTFSSPITCHADPATGDFSECFINGTDPLLQPSTHVAAENIALNPTQTIAYVSDQNSLQTYQCSVSPVNGILSGCFTTSVGNTFYVITNATNTFLYAVGNILNDVIQCSIGPNGVPFGCGSAGATIAQVSGVALYY